MKIKSTLFLCLAISCGASAIKTLIWNTLSERNVDFCEHVNAADSYTFSAWYDQLIETVHLKGKNDFSSWSVENIIVERPVTRSCHTFFINLIIETHGEDAILRDKAKAFALSLHDTTQEHFNVIIRARPLVEIFDPWSPERGVYVFRSDGDQSPYKEREMVSLGRSVVDVTTDTKNTIDRLARRRGIVIDDSWMYENTVFISIEKPLHLSPTALEQFNKDVQRNLNFAVQVLVL